MAHEASNIAPWAEIVPDAPYPMSVEEFEQWPEEPGWRYELVHGRVVRMPPPGGRHGVIQGNIVFALKLFVLPRGLGEVVDGSEFVLPGSGVSEQGKLGPDVAFVAAGREPASGTQADEDNWAIARDLAVEIASPKANQYRPQMTEKAKEYLRAAVRLVWIFYPQWNEVDAWWQGEQGPESQTLQASQQLDGRDVLPGFTHLIGPLFLRSGR